jgi:hypothetical protein
MYSLVISYGKKLRQGSICYEKRNNCDPNGGVEELILKSFLNFGVLINYGRNSTPGSENAYNYSASSYIERIE